MIISLLWIQSHIRKVIGELFLILNIPCKNASKHIYHYWLSVYWLYFLVTVCVMDMWHVVQLLFSATGERITKQKHLWNTSEHHTTCMRVQSKQWKLLKNWFFIIKTIVLVQTFMLKEAPLSMKTTSHKNKEIERNSHL